MGRRDGRLAGWLEKEKIKDQECFTVVRNPYDRVISCWQHCKRGRGGLNLSFEEWLEMDFNDMGPQHRVHSIRQVDYLFDCEGSVNWIDHVLKLEDPEFVRKLQKITGIKEGFPHEAKGGYEKEEFYTPYARELVKSKYSLDFKIFGYKK